MGLVVTLPKSLAFLRGDAKMRWKRARIESTVSVSKNEIRRSLSSSDSYELSQISPADAVVYADGKRL